MIRFARLTIIATLSLMVSACGVFGGNDEKEMKPLTTALGVNAFLWRATLDTLAFMPIDNAYPSSGAIISDWYSTADAPTERVKVAVYFHSKQLRSDGVKVNVVREQLVDGNWLIQPVQAATVLQIEEAILSRARVLRIEADG
jgi:hypothetical protein